MSADVELNAGQVKRNLERIQAEIAEAATRAGRGEDEVELVAATKYVPVNAMGVLADAGITLVGENRMQDLRAKQERWGDRFRWDFIGHLQSRKVKEVLPRVRLIHSVESESVVRRLAQHAVDGIEVLMEVSLAGEAGKFGVSPSEIDKFLQTASGWDAVRFVGLMTMPPIASDPEEVRPYFAELRKLSVRLEADWTPRHRFSILSMGTSQDYVIAVEEGATIVRIGSNLYGGFLRCQAKSPR